MKRLLSFLFISFMLLNVSAQQWTLKTPVKSSSRIRSVYMLNDTLGYALDQLEQRILRTDDAGWSWKRMYYYITSQPYDLWMMDDLNGIICASSGRFYITDDGFETYTSVSTSMGTMYGLHFINDSVGFACGDQGKILKTTDKGQNWTLLTTNVTDLLFNLYFVNDTLGYAGGNSGRIIKTVDGGQTWTSLTTGTTSRVTDLWFSDTQNGIAVGSGGMIMSTSNGGTSWTQQTSPTTQYIQSIRQSGSILMASCNWGDLLRSTNNGQSWTLINIGAKDMYSAHINTNGYGIAGGSSVLYSTADYGQTWSVLQNGVAHSKLMHLSFADSLNGLAVGYKTTGGFLNAVIYTSDGGNHWGNIYTNASSNSGILGVHLLSNGEGVYGGSSGLNAKTTNYGLNWSYGANRPSVAVRAVWAFSTNSYLMGGGYVNSGIYRTDDAGFSWSHTSGGTIQDFYFPTDSIGYAVGDGGACMKTTDGGLTWASVNTGTYSDLYSAFFLNDSLGFVGGNSCRKTTDGGQTWTLLAGAGSTVRSILFLTPDSGYAVNYSGIVTKTIDGGTTWTTVLDGLVDQAVNDAELVNGVIVAVGNRGDVYTMPLFDCSLLPDPVISLSNDTLFSSAANGNQWYENGVLIPGANDTWYVPTHTASYYTVVSDMGCITDSSNNIQVVFVGYNEDHQKKAFVIYPNPGTDRLSFRYGSDISGNAFINIFSPDGKLVLRREIHSANETIDLSALRKGFYLISFEHNDRLEYHRWVKH